MPSRNCCTSISSTTDRKSTRLNSSHSQISYAVFCLKKKIEPDVDLGRDDELVTVVELRDLDLRMTEHVYSVLSPGLAVDLGQRVVDCLVGNRLSAD